MSTLDFARSIIEAYNTTTPIYDDEIRTVNAFARQSITEDDTAGYVLTLKRETDVSIMIDNTESVGYELYVFCMTSLGDNAAGAAITFQGNVGNSPAFMSFTIDPFLTPELRLENYPAGAEFLIFLTYNGTAKELPCRVRLQAYLPNPQYANAVLGQARLGSFTLPDPKAVTPFFTLGTSRLNRATLYDKANLHAWQDLTSEATQIDISRSLQVNGFIFKGEPGTMQASFYNAHDPRASGMTRGTPVRVIDVFTRRPLFTGTTDAVKSTYEKSGDYRVTITAYDMTAELANTAKYQAAEHAQRTWLLATYQLLSAYVQSGRALITNEQVATVAIGRLMKESSVLDYLDIYSATAGLYWHVMPSNRLRITDKLPGTPRAQIATLSQDLLADVARLDPVEIDAALDTTQIVSAVEVTNYSATADDAGQLQSSTQTLRAENATTQAAYGTNRITFETAAADVAELEAALNARLASYEPLQIIQQAVFTPYLRHTRSNEAELSHLTTLDLLDCIAVNYRATAALTTITAISHTITPHSWQTTLNLTQRKAD